MNGIRIYFDARDPLGCEVKCFGDYLKQEHYLGDCQSVLITDWGFIDTVRINGEDVLMKIQPAWLFEVVNSKKSEVVFPDYEGTFNEYPTVR